MKWLKKINQLFTHKELRDDYEQQPEEKEEVVTEQHDVARDVFDVEQQPAQQKPTLSVTETPKEVVEQAQRQKEAKTGAFRFPLIPDDEDAEFVLTPPLPEKREERVQQQELEQQDPLHIVLEPEPHTQGIRKLLAERKHGIRRTKEQYRPTSPPVEELPKKQPKLKEMHVEPIFEQRRFVPTVVPSPIFGYGERTDLTKKPDVKEPSTINELLGKHRQEVSMEPVVTQPQQLQEERHHPIDVTNKSILQTVESAYEELPHMQTQVATQQEEPTFEQTKQPNITVHTMTPHDVIDEHVPLTFENDEETIVHEATPQIEIVEAQQDVVQLEDAVQESPLPQELTQHEVEVLADNEEDAAQQAVTSSVEEAIAEEVPHVEQVIEAIVEEVPEAAIEQEAQQSVSQPTTLDVQQMQVEELVVHNVQIVEDEAVTVEQEAQDEQQAFETPPIVSRTVEKARPFNVVMLKSDKEKLEKKAALTQLLEPMMKKPSPIVPCDIQSTTDIPPFCGEVIEEERLDEPVALQPIEENVQLGQQVEEHAIEEEMGALQDEPLANVVSEALLPQEEVQEASIEANTLLQEVIAADEVEEEIIIEPNPIRPYTKPSDRFLVPPEENLQDTVWMEEQGERLVDALSHFQVKAQIESIVQGPAVTQFEITVEQGTKVSKVRNLSDDLKLALAARDIRIQAPIPGKNTIGIEIPNRLSRAVRLSEVTASETFIASSSPLEAALGLDLTGAPVTIDLRKMPHGLIAGATGSGKSVCINSILVSLLYKAAPHELKLLLIDPKMVELAPFNHIPHLVSPVITDVKAATAALKWAVEEMERRYQLFAHMGVRDLERYNKLADKNEQPGHKLPYILIVIDELADLMMMAPHEVEEAICRIAQKARACGIHLIVATQRPSVDVITGLIKSNIPTRIAFMVSSQIDSRTILDSVGAERLLGRGDMLYLGNGESAAVRLQGTFVTDDEIEDIIDHVRAQGEPDYIFKQEELLRKTEMTEKTDELFEEVCRFVYERQSASTSAIQRHYSIGYSRAARLVDMLEAHGFVSEAKTGNKARDVFITQEEIENMFA